MKIEGALRRLRTHGHWLVYVALAVVCTKYLNDRTDIVPKRGEWYSTDHHILLQVRSFLSGRLAIVPHPLGGGHDYDWGRGGLHTAWGLGVPILALPFHIVARWFGAPGFPDHVRFLFLYAMTTFVLVRALHATAPEEPNALVASSLAAAFVMVFPTFIGLLAARFRIYDETIATGALWSILLLAGVLLLLERSTPGRLATVCAAAGFSIMIRPPLAVYGLTTAVLATAIAHRKGTRPRALLAGIAAYAGATTLYFVGNVLRFGGAFHAGFENGISGPFVGRLTRWGLPFAKVPFLVAAKELFATLFFLEPVSSQMMGAPPASLLPYIRPDTLDERWREYYSPTYDTVILALWLIAVAIVCWRVIRGRLWRADRDLAREAATVVGAWATPPVIVLFVFYTRIGNLVTRYLVDMYPAFAAAALSVGMATVDAIRRRAPTMVGAAQLAIAGAVALYISGWRGWATGLSHPVDAKVLVSDLAAIDAHATDVPSVPDHFACGQPRGREPVHTHLEEWRGDCSFSSGMAFAMPHSRCVSFTLVPASGAWNAPENESLDELRATGDFDHLVRCGHPVIDGSKRRITMCESRRPPFLLDGLRLYSIASLDESLKPIDRLKLLQIDSASSCP